MKSGFSRAFTLVELMVVVAIIGILSAIVIANLANSAKQGRDAQRQADLRNLQTAIETYKKKVGMYPEAGCNEGTGWAKESDPCPEYIKDLAPDYISQLPHDPARGTKDGYSYITNNARTVYKIMAMNTVEADILDYDHPFKSCDIRYGDGTNFPGGAPANKIDLYGWCSQINTDGTSNGFDSAPASCVRKIDEGVSDKGSNGRFDRSYGLWGGFEPLTNTAQPRTSRYVWKTTEVICK